MALVSGGEICLLIFLQVLVRRRDPGVDDGEVRREPGGDGPGPPDLRPLPHTEGGPQLQGVLGMGTQVSHLQ